MKRIPFEKKYHIRIIVLIFFIFIIFLLASMRLFNFQLVLGKEFLDVAQKNSDTTVPIVAARGEIVDRNLVPLTSNKAIFNIEFDYSFMEKGTENEIILKLINLFEKQQEEWNDELPITLEKPYKFLEGREADVKRLKKRIVVNSYATAEDCMENIFKDYKIKKYENTKGKCTHCGKKIENCDFVGYDEITSRKIAGVRYQMVLKDYSKKNRFVFAEDISPNTVSILREFKADFTGIDIVERSQRTYISGDVASHLIGSIGPIYSEELEYYKNKGYLINDKVGKSGIEKAAEDYLRGKNGLLRITKNSNGEIVDVVEEIPPEAGKTVKLTIDYEFQKEIQQILSDYIKEFNEKKVRPNKDPNEKPKFVEAGAVLVLDTTNNDVLASVSYPYYDINESYSTLVNREDNPLFNNALNGTFRPGSTFKPIVAAAGLQEGIINTKSEIFCTGKYLFYSDYQPGCLSHGHGRENLDVSQALQHSCNIFFYDVGRILGINRMNMYANYFGLGTDTGLEIPSTVGNLSSREFSESHNANWENGNVIQAAIGQMDTSITPLQMAIEASTIANKGTRYNAHLIKGFLTHDMKETVYEKPASIASEFDMSQENYDAITKGMIAAGAGISSPNQLTDLGYQVAVKTGTPQVSSTKTNTAFIAFKPVDKPQVAVSCLLDDGQNCSELIRRILLAYDKHFNTNIQE